jgi:hypothetical protein
MSKPPPLAPVKHADDYTTEDLNADVDAFSRAFDRYMRPSRAGARRTRVRRSHAEHRAAPLM